MRRFRREAGVAAAVVALALLGLSAPGFWSAGTLRALASDLAPLLVAACGMTFVILCGHIDVSVGSQLAVCGVTAGVLSRAGLPPSLVIVLTLAAGATIGALNGGLVAGLGIPSIVATLATMAILRGVLRALTGGEWVQDLPPTFQWFGLGQDSGQAVFAVAALFVFAIAVAAARWTHAGRAVFAVGCDPEAARLCGLRPGLVVFGVFTLMGLASAGAALLDAARYPAIEAEAGAGFELRVIAAVVVGGTAVSGGRGSLAGTFLGVLLLGMLGTALVFLRVEAAWERAVQGGVILAAVASALFGTRGTGALARG